ncbi:E3 ubiquitin-protein ligase HUWE1-like isoform X3 [Halichondria panicea]|uniref:E3 ubiquitin-protein ligase HUWE1-like isoform X3 n=1 Tax=Halichondria panicea TaxID=6063 RepID=UPI00312B9C8F
MKIEKTKPKKGVSELPPVAKELTEKLQTCSDEDLVRTLQSVSVWRYGKCELYHWVDALDRFDEILEQAASREAAGDTNINCVCMCPKLKDPEFKEKVVAVLNFTSLLIEHSYARHIYNSTEHLFALLGCPDLEIVLAALNLFYVFSKRSNFISRLSAKKRSSLNSHLEYLGETWGGKQSGFGLAECCTNADIKTFPASCTSVFFKYQPETEKQEGQSLKPSTSIFLENLHEGSETIPEVMRTVTSSHKIPLQAQMQLLSRVRLAKNFPNFEQRLKCILARLQALSILVYSNGPAEIVDPLIYEGFVEELVEVLETKEKGLMEIKASVLRTLTAIIHLERDPKLMAIVESTGAAAYHGFLPSLVRDCVASFTSSVPSEDQFPLTFNTALFSFLYHLATYETSGDALVTSGIMESLLQVLEWKAFEPMNITLVTRAVRVIDLVTGLDMSAFHSLGGWDKMLSRLEIEVDKCRGDAPIILPSELVPVNRRDADSLPAPSSSADDSAVMETDTSMEVGEAEGLAEVSCMPERAALIKSILNFLKKAVPEATFAENIRNFVDSSLPKSLKHIVSNAEYYGSSIYLPATELTTVFIFQEPSQLSSLQDNGLPGVVLNSVITKRIPATREVLSSLPNILSAMCLNARGLQSFIAAEPFDHLFSVLISPEYLPAMRKKKGAELGDTASILGVAMDELMRHQPALRVNVIAALVRLLKILLSMGSVSEKNKPSMAGGGRKMSTVDPLNDDHMSADSDVDDDDEESEGGEDGGEGADRDSPSDEAGPDKRGQLLTEYVINVIRFLDAILTNNSTKDHVIEFSKQGGLKPLIQLLALPTLPVDFPSSHGFNALCSTCRGILNLASPSDLLAECLGQLSSVLKDLSVFLDSPNSSKSILLEEVGPLSNVPEAIKTPQGSPLLHKLAIANSFMQLFVYFFKACCTSYTNLETREACLKQFASVLGKEVLGQLSQLYRALVWEVFILLAVAADEEKKKREKKSDVENMDTSSSTKDADSSASTLLSEEVISKLSPAGGNMSCDQPQLLVDSLKHITPLLTITSKVGRSLAEFMNLLIRISITPLVRNPHRSRFRDDPYVAPSEDALQICDKVTLLLVESLQWEVPSPSKCEQAMRSPIKDWLFNGMTFKMYAADFCELLLFDEHKQVYHMILFSFDKKSGLEAFINTFHVALKVINEEEEGTSLYGSSVDFLEAWLNLAEKFLNTSAVISSNHYMAVPPHEQTDNKRLVYNPMFNPLDFFVRTQKAILPCLKALWDSPRLSKLTLKVIELLLASIRHFYRSEEPMEKKLDEYIAADKREDPLSQLARVRAEMEAEDRAKKEKEEKEKQEAARREREANEPPAPPKVDPHHLQQLCDMGFARAHAEEALEACGNELNAAMEWIFSHPATESRDSNMAGLSEEEAISRAIALSLANEETETEEQKAEREQEEARKKEEDEERERQEAEEKEKEYNALRAMDKSILEDFSNVLLPSSIELGSVVPECVSRVCDLIVSMAKRNGDGWWCQGLERVKNTILQSVEKMSQDVMSKQYVKPKKLIMEPLACQLQLLSMIMEEMPVPCARVVCEPKFLAAAIQLLDVSQGNINTLCAPDANMESDKLHVPATPKWLQALLTFIDIWGKTMKIAKWWRPERDDCIVVWQWFENSRWCSYSHDLGQCLEKSYLNGDYCYSVRSGRSRYESFRNVVMFDPMLQVNTETGAIRAVIRLEVARNSRRYKKKEELDKEEPVIPYVLKIHEDGSAAPCKITEENSHKCLKYCVRLLSAPIDPDTLNATLRLCLRFTREATGSTLFIEAGGPQAILSLKTKSGFKGFSPLAVNIFRHCIEDQDTMKRTMQYIVKSCLTTPSSIVKEVRPTGNGMKDYHYVLRRLAPIASRNEDMLTSICTSTLRVKSKVPRSESYFVSQRPTPTYLDYIGPNKIPEAPLTPSQSSIINLLIDHLCSDPFVGDTQSCTETDEGRVEDVAVPRMFRGTRRNRDTSFRRNQPGRFDDDDDDLTIDGEDHPSRQTSSSGNPTNSSSPIEDPGIGLSSGKKESEGEQLTERPLLSKAATLKLLAETLDSYPQCGPMIVSSSRAISINGQPPKEMTILAFIFDFLIPSSSNSNSRIQNLAKLAKSFVHCIATANYKPEVINILVVEFKAALSRALCLPESLTKHNRIRSLTGLLGLVTDYNVLVTRGPVNPGQFARLLIRKGIISDMTRALYHLDLTSSLLPLTLNGILKPLEALTRVVNQVATTSRQTTNIVKPNTSIPEASSEPVNRASTTNASQLPRSGEVATSSPAVVAGATSTAAAISQPSSQDLSEEAHLDATHESLVPLEDEEEGEEPDIAMETDRDPILNTVASLAHGIGRVHRQQRESAEVDGDDGLSDGGEHSADMMVEEGGISDEVTDSDLEDDDDDEVDVLEDGCNSAGEEVEDDEFDESQLDSSHLEVDSDLSDTDSSHSDDEDTEVEDAEGSDEGQSLEDSEVHGDNTGADDSFNPSQSQGEGDISYMEEEEEEDDSDLEGEDVLQLDYDFEDDINEEMDYFIDMPWGVQDGEIQVTDGRSAGGTSYTRSLHTRPGQHNSTDLDSSVTSFTGQTIPLRHPLLTRTSDHSSQLAQRVRLGSAVSFETPMPIGGVGSQSSEQPESAMHQLLAHISVAAGSNDGLVYGVGSSGAQRMRQSPSSREQSVQEELESPVIQNALGRWEETSAIIDGPATVHCMHELRDSIKATWGAIFLKCNPQNSSDEELFSSSRRRNNRSTASTATTTTTTTTTTPASTSQQSTTSTSTVTTTTTTAAASAVATPSPAMATPPTSTVTATRTITFRSEPNTTNVPPNAPHPSDQATPSSPRDASTSVDQLRSSLRQVADALAQTVAAVRSTREQLTERDEEVTAMEGVVEARDQVSNATSSIMSTQAASSVAASTAVSSQLITTTTASNSAHPIMATFDGTQESAVASLAATNREDPLYTFLSAVAGAPTPPTTDTPSSQPPPPTSIGELTNSTSETPTNSQSAIRTPVIQDARPLSLAEPSPQDSFTLGDVQSMEEQSAGDNIVTEPVNSDAPDIASQVNSFFAQHPVSRSSSTNEGSPYLAQDFASVVDSLARASARVNTRATDAMQRATPPSSSQSQQSPSPSDTLAPLLLSSLQLPSNTVASTPTSNNLQATVLHDHPHSSATATMATPSPQGASSSLPSDMLTPTTVAAGSLSIAASNTTPPPAEGASSQETPESSAIDPTFLAALPLSIRHEVLAQHRREERVRQPPSEQQEVEAPFQSSISPEFLSALPPTIQSEVIQQERLERVRQQGSMDPIDPLDNSSFFRNLPSDLRRTILSDLDESSFGHLPDDLANEARRLQQDRESRRRQMQAQRDAFLERMMEEAHIRAEASGAGGSGTNSGVPHPFSHHSFEAAGLHYAIVNLNPYALIDMPTYRPDRRALAAQAAAKGEPNSKQMLAPESLVCILVPLFLDHNRIHINRLHRIIKNVCQHISTRSWVLSSLLEIIRKLQHPLVRVPCPMPPMLTSQTEEPSTSGPRIVPSPHPNSPHWLNISISAALGSHTQVFQVEQPRKAGANPSVKIHPLASTNICNNVLDLLVFLARQFQSSFLPAELLPVSTKSPAVETDQQRVVSKFWNTLLKLDNLSSRKSRSVLRLFQYTDPAQFNSDAELFESSILGQLISLFSQDIFKDSIPLTDKLLRVLNYASTAIPKTGLVRKILFPSKLSQVIGPDPSQAKGDEKMDEKMDEKIKNESQDNKDLSLISPHLLRTVVSVLISGRCSEDGLEDATSLLTNLSKCSIETREQILVILLEGVKAIGQTLSSQISTLFENLSDNMESLMDMKPAEGVSSDSKTTVSILTGVVLPSIATPEQQRHTDHSNDLHLPSMVPLTCKGSQQSFFLRMLKVVCQLRESAQSAIATQRKPTMTTTSARGRGPPGRAPPRQALSTSRPMEVDQPSSTTSVPSSQKFMLQPLSLQLELEELWSMLSDCLDALGRTKDSHAVLVLQPLVEAFFLVHADSNDDLKQSTKRRGSLLTRTGRLASYHTLGDSDMPPDSPAPAPMDSISPVPGTPGGDSEIDLYAHLPPDIARFLKFAEKHRTVLNQILRQSTIPLSEGPFSVLVHHTKVLDFDVKRRYFRHELDQTDDGMRRDDIVVHIRRDHIFEDSFRELYRRSSEELKGNLYIQFEGEEGQDVGGLLREWYLIIAREMFNPNYALFQLTSGDRVTYIPNALSYVNPNHLNYFKFIGRVIAKAIYDNKLLDCYFTRSFYKHILGKPVHFSDIEAEDYAFYQGMVYLLEHNYGDLGIDLNFTTEVQEFGKTEVKELKPDGTNLVVTEANKREYVQLACQMKMTGSIQAQIKSFLEGFYEVIPKDLISIFNEQELELLISGLPSIDIDDLKANTEYHKYSETSLQIQWFWRALRSFDQADRARFLQFVTGTSKVPLQGFAALEGMNGLQKFQIHRDDRSTDRLPCAHTCFNQLDLPPYPTYDKLYDMLLTAVRECPEGFGLA